MPLFVNGEWFNPTLSKETQLAAHRPYKEEYDAFMEKAEHFKYPVELRVKRTDKTMTDSKGNPVEKPTDNLSFRSRIVTPRGTETWVYQKSFPNRVDGEYVFRDIAQWVRGKLLIQKQEVEKLFYFMKKSVAINTALYHYDPAAIARERAESETARGQVFFHLYNSQSEISQNDNKIRDIARSLGVKRVTDMTIDEVKTKLQDAVFASKKGIKTFLDLISKPDESSKQSKIQIAIEKGVIVYNSTESEWRFKDRDKETATICKVDAGDRGKEKEALVEYLLRHPETENRVLRAGRTGKLSDLTEKDVPGLTNEELRRECAIAGIPFYRKGRDKTEVIEELQEWVRFLENVKR